MSTECKMSEMYEIIVANKGNKHGTGDIVLFLMSLPSTEEINNCIIKNNSLILTYYNYM